MNSLLKLTLLSLPALLPLLFAKQLEQNCDFSTATIRALVILILAASLWISEAVPLFVTSLLILFLAITWLTPNLPGLEAGSAPFLATFFSDITLLFLSGFVLSAALHKYQLDEQMARWIIRRTGKSYPRLLLGLMLITAILSMFLSNTATSAIESGRAALSLAEDEQQAVHKEFQELVEKLTAQDPPGDSDEFPIL